MNFYDKYSRLCNNRNISPCGAAIQMGIAKSSVSRWGRGQKPTRATLIKICDFFDVPVSYFDEPPEGKKSGPPMEHREADNRLNQITRAWRGLNEEGRTALLDYLDYLTSTPRYTRQSPPRRA